ncbi:zinc permease [candidate division MSBL1 archaeon SCGC-AAA259A05]|uniref:Zinc permease n=1 Tax=candidate division MSBL1 archaeon SCGC-AAA259A05 TaxID=1698259 RepID=A0A133UC18_9EURY|nr:zinc permease [candidate division MSBL1 archaeon SCGC-AAA259A05]
MSSSFLPVLAASLLSALLCTLGILTIWNFREWAKKSTNYFMYFASGVLIAVAFLIASPKAFEMNDRGPVYLLAGFLGIFLINRFMGVYICHERELKRECRIGLVGALGIAFHSLVDGVIYATTYTVSIFLGAMATLGMIFHEFPEGIVAFSLFTKSGFGGRKSLFYAFLVAALTTPIGAIVSFPFISSLQGPNLGVLMGLAAGVLAYVGVGHLLPEAEREAKKYGLLAFALGILVAVGLTLTKGG